MSVPDNSLWPHDRLADYFCLFKECKTTWNRAGWRHPKDRLVGVMQTNCSLTQMFMNVVLTDHVVVEGLADQGEKEPADN